MCSQLRYFKAQLGKTRKETLLMLYNDIIKELQHIDAVQTECILEDESLAD